MQERDRLKDEEIKRIVRDGYRRIAEEGSGCRSADYSCCGGTSQTGQKSMNTPYSAEEIESSIEEANLGLGCGNPLRHAEVKPGDIVVDLGCGAGFDVFLAGKQVGENGRVIGVDMTYEMLERARACALKINAKNVEFRLGEIENLPVIDGTADVVISNCVINLVPNKQRAFDEAFRILKPSGRMIVSDTVLLNELPETIRASSEALVGCVAGAELKNDYLEMIKKAGFTGIEILDETPFPKIGQLLGKEPVSHCCGSEQSADDAEKVLGSIVSITVRAYKPEQTRCCG